MASNMSSSANSQSPTVSISTVSNLSDVLRDLPLASPTDYINDETIHVNLFDNKQHQERAAQLMQSTDAYLCDLLNRTLTQIDTSKIQMNPHALSQEDGLVKQPIATIPPILQTTLLFNPKLYNGALSSIHQQLLSNTNPQQIQQQQQQMKQTMHQINNESISTSLSSNLAFNGQIPGTSGQPSTSIASNIKTENKEPIVTSKFYSSKTQTNNEQQQTKQQESQLKPSSGTKVKSERNTNKNNSLNTWQADIKSQLALPDDFTPELISQLAAEGYDITGFGSRKARARQGSTQHHQQLLDSSDEDNEEGAPITFKSKKDQDYNSTKIIKTSKSTNQQAVANEESFRSIRVNRAKLTDVCDDPTEHASFKRFNQILDDLLETFEQDLEQMNRMKLNAQGQQLELDEIPGEYLLTRQTCADLVQEAFKLSTYSIMNAIKKESLLKLQHLLYFNIKDGVRSIQLSDEQHGHSSEQDKLLREILVEKLLRAADCSIISLIIMTAPNISKELIIEDNIEQISAFSKLHLTETIFPHYDPIYKVDNQSKLASSNSAASSTKRKIINQFGQTNSTSSSASSSNSFKTKNIQHFYNRMREILNLIGEIVCQIDMTDTIVITLSSLSVMCFFVENINDLQLETLKILTNLFTRYEKHRQLVLDDILSSLVKLHSTKRNIRTYKCFNGDSIQMFSALLLQLIQCEVNTIDVMQLESATSLDEISFEQKESHLINSYESSCQTAKKFLSVFFSKCKTKQADSDFRPIFENFIQDLLITVNKPEWPVSEIILNLLGIILVNQIQNDQNDVGSRVNSLEYLGQIVSQLRKDSLEYQNNPERIKNALDKIIQNKTLDLTQIDDDELFNLQMSLINYLDTLVTNDSALKYSKCFLIAQWLKEINNQSMEASNQLEHGQERMLKHDKVEENRKRLYQLIETKFSTNLLDANEAFVLSKYLCSLKKTLDKNFDYYLVNILSLSGGSSDVPTQVRSKAIKCLSLIIEADPQILLKQKVFACVEANFLHQTISVREASVDLIGRFITLKPELTNHYYKLLSDRILDVGVSVRKRTIKIFRDVCLNQPDFEHLAEICVKILRRINDEDAIKKLVIDMFYNVWFAPLNNREGLLKRVLNIVDVVSEFNSISNTASAEIFEQLFNALIVQPAKEKDHYMMDDNELASSSSNVNQTSVEHELQVTRSKEVVKACKQIVDCLVENVLNIEANTNSTQTEYRRLVASFSTLYLLSKIKPENFINHAETLLPYLNIKSTNQNDNQIINNAAKILECVIPLLQSPSNSFLISLEESLCKLIFQGGMLIVSSCISCLGTVVNKLTKNYKLAVDCFAKFYNNASYLKRTLNIGKPLEQNTKPLLFRMLFTLGLLSKHFDVESEEFAEYKLCTKQDLFTLFLHFISSCDVDVKHKALIGLGSFLSRYSEFMIKEEIKTLYLNYIKGANVPIMLKSQIFINLTDYLNEEDQRNLSKSVELTKGHCKDDLKEMLDVQSGMASTIIQSYLKPILDSYLTANTALRINIFNCLSMILNQGLVYPIECVPYLIAMTTDNEKKIQSKALIHLTNLQKAHPGFVQSKSIAGVNVSYLLQKVIKTAEQDPVVRGFSEIGEVLSMNHHLYSLLRSNRSYRRAFLQQLLKMFDDSTLHRASLAHMLYISDNLAYFPYQLMDEPLYLIHHIDIIISVTGINLLQSFKENLLNYTANGVDTSERKHLETKRENNNYESSDFDMNCPDEADDNDNKEMQLSTANKKSHMTDDDEEETFETVFLNLPTDLKPLRDCMYKAQGCCLLLILKHFLKEIYSISDSKIQSYSPNDTAKVNERPITSRKTNRRFNPKQIIDYMKRADLKQSELDEDELKQSLVREYLEFKELILCIDSEESKLDENKQNGTSINTTNNGSTTRTPNETNQKIFILQQKLFEGIEKTKSSASGQDSVNATPRKTPKANKNKHLSSSAKKSAGKEKKRKRKKDSDDESDSDFDINSDLDDET